MKIGSVIIIMLTWSTKMPSAPAYEVRLVWHSSTDKDPAHQWMRALVHKLFRRPARTDSV